MNKNIIIFSLIIVLFASISMHFMNKIPRVHSEAESKWIQLNGDLNSRMEIVSNAHFIKDFLSQKDKIILKDISALTEQIKVLNTTKMKIDNFVFMEKYMIKQNELNILINKLFDIILSEGGDINALIALKNELNTNKNNLIIQMKNFIFNVEEYNLIVSHFPGNLFTKILYGYNHKVQLDRFKKALKLIQDGKF